MSKVLIISLYYLFCLSFEIKMESSLVKMDLKGKVKSITIKNYLLGNTDSISKVRFNKYFRGEYHLFNKDGNTLADYDIINDKMCISYKCEYNKEGNITEQIDYNPEGKVNFKYTYVYDNSMFTTEILYYEREKYQFKCLKKYNTSGYNIQEVFYDSIGNFESCIYYKFDENNNKIEEKRYLPNNKLNYAFEFFYLDNKILKENYGWYSLEYIYDKDKNLKKKIKYEHEKLYEIHEFTYDLKNQCLKKMTINFKGDTIWVQTNIYNDLGYITTSCSQEKKLSVYKDVYKYDEFGNWIEKISYSNERPYGLTKRLIEYY
jgi:hypothetical protein